MRNVMCLLLLCGSVALASGQIRITATRQLDLPAGQQWLAPRFAPDGLSLFLTTSGYTGIYRYVTATGELQTVTDESGAGFGFAVSNDGNRLAYRRTTYGRTAFERTQEIVDVDILRQTRVQTAAGGNLSTPVFHHETILYSKGAETANIPQADGTVQSAVLLGIEETKIALVVDGRKILLDPFNGGSYIWPSLSPDGSKLVAYEMSRGTFVCDLTGKVEAHLGRRDAPVWTRNGRWIIGVEEKGDGHRISGADLYALAADGSQVIRLTDSPAIELNPFCSPSSNTILCNTADGKILLLQYEEVLR
jgi:Tol biopolymer transport system component